MMDKKVFETGCQMGSYPTWIKILLLAPFPLVGVCLIALAVLLFWAICIADGYPIFIGIIVFLFILPPAVFCLHLGWVFIAQGLARYSFEVNGLKVKYPLQKERRIPWEDFQQVCVCNTYDTRDASAYRARAIICCVKKGEKTDSCGRWKTSNPYRYRSVICIGYSDELYEGIKERCPYEVPNLRETLTYRPHC